MMHLAGRIILISARGGYPPGCEKAQMLDGKTKSILKNLGEVTIDLPLPLCLNYYYVHE